MNQKNLVLILLFLGLVLCLVACTSTSAVNEISNIPPTATLASQSSAQPTPIVVVFKGTFTPAPAAICPNVNSVVATLNIGAVSETFEQSYEQPILDFLNAGGSIDVLRQELQNLMQWFDVRTIDVTNDTEPEVIVEANKIYIFGCSNGIYHSLLVIDHLPLGYSPTIETIKDMNLDGIPEIVASRTYGGQTPAMQVEILEWDGKQFRSLLARDNVCSRNGFSACVWNGVPDILDGDVKLVDIDNGTTELLISGGVALGSPTKPVTFAWRWNGSEFILFSIDLPSP